MRRTALAALAGVLLAIVPVTTQAGAQTGAQVTIVDAATYGSGHPFPGTLCVNGNVVYDPFQAGDIKAPKNWAAGTYQIAFLIGSQSCTGKPDATKSVTVANGDDITIAVIWDSTGRKIVVWPNNNACLAADEARVTVRHGADTRGAAVNVFATYDGSEHKVVSSLAEGAQDVSPSSAPFTYKGVNLRLATTDAAVLTIGDLTFNPGVQYVIYVYGGSDGNVGYFMDQITEPTCPTATTTAPVTTTTTAQQAAVVTQPVFTG